MRFFGSLLIVGVLLSGPPAAAADQAPHRLAGFALGTDIAQYRDLVEAGTELPIRYQPYLREVEVKEPAGYKSGLIIYGTCARPGRIVRIKLKYQDSSKQFYEQLLKRFKAKFGERAEWRGDPFHVVVAWKWSFIDAAGNDISLILQHNVKDDEEKKGNSVKLTAWNMIEDEQRCHARRHPPQPEERQRRRRAKDLDWERFIPQ